MNFLPFGYHKSFVINVGSSDDTKVGEFYLEPSKDLSERKTAADGTTYRELNGTANVVFKPKAVLKNAEITVSVEGEGVSIIPPVIDFDPSTVKWDYSWDFTKEIPKDLTGNAFMFDGAATFNGKDTRLQLTNSSDNLEDGPMSIYAEWTPTDSDNSTQQVVGHYNWEIWQNKDSVEFRTGRMNNADGSLYSIKYPVKPEFFGAKHTVLAIYVPSDNGYIELYVDENFAGRTYFKVDKIWKEYGDQNLTFGWTPHNYSKSPYYSGSLTTVKISLSNAHISGTTNSFKILEGNSTIISLISPNLAKIRSTKLDAKK
jgi:hypothetical protein